MNIQTTFYMRKYCRFRVKSEISTPQRSLLRYCRAHYKLTSDVQSLPSSSYLLCISSCLNIYIFSEKNVIGYFYSNLRLWLTCPQCFTIYFCFEYVLILLLGLRNKIVLDTAIVIFSHYRKNIYVFLRLRTLQNKNNSYVDYFVLRPFTKIYFI